MEYSRIVNYVASAVWAILPEKMDEITSVLAYRAAGHVFTPAEIEARIGGKRESATQARQGSVAVIPLRGVIAHRMGAMDDMSGGMSAERFTAMVKAVVADDSIGTILIDVDSPGGTVAGLMEAADAVYGARDTKQVVAIANSTMASAAYWIASQAHEIVAIPSVLDRAIGSIGVFMVHQDLSAKLEKEGVKVSIIKAGTHKAAGNPFEPLSDETRAEIQGTVDSAYAEFVKAVARGRGISAADVKKGYGEGRAFSAVDALAAGLIDRIDTFDATTAQLTGKTSRSVVGLAAENLDTSLSMVFDASADHDADRLRRLERF